MSIITTVALIIIYIFAELTTLLCKSAVKLLNSLGPYSVIFYFSSPPTCIFAPAHILPLLKI